MPRVASCARALMPAPQRCPPERFACHAASRRSRPSRRRCALVHADNASQRLSFRARGRVDLHPARDRRRMSQRRAALLRRQGFRRRAAPGAKGVRSRKGRFTLLHIDTEQNSPKSSRFATAWRATPVCALVVRSLDESIRAGASALRDPAEPRNPHQSVTLLDTIAEFGSTPASAAPVATRKRRAPRSAYSRSATSSANGTRGTSGPNCGRCTTPACTRARTSACSRSRTGRRWTCGIHPARSAFHCLEIYFAHEREVIRRGGALVPVTHAHAGGRAANASSGCSCASAPSAT